MEKLVYYFNLKIFIKIHLIQNFPTIKKTVIDYSITAFFIIYILSEVSF